MGVSRVGRGLGGWGQEIQRLGGVQVAPRCPQSAPSSSEQSPWACWPLFLVCVLCCQGCPLCTSLLAGAEWWRVSRIPLCGMEGQEEEDQDQGAEPPARRLRHGLRPPGPGPEEGAACPRYSSPAPQGSLAAEPASWAPAKPNSCQGERKKHFRAERPPVGSNSNLESPFLTAK